MKTWLKGGFIGGGIGLIYSYQILGGRSSFIYYFPSLLTEIICEQGFEGIACLFFIVLPAMIIGLALLGVLIGFLIDKFRNKR